MKEILRKTGVSDKIMVFDYSDFQITNDDEL
jgi:hypothetical protein